MSYRTIHVMNDDEFIEHLELDHPGDIAQTWPSGGRLRRLAARQTYEVYHDTYLHRAPRRADHAHASYSWTGWEGKEMSNKGWVQRTPCNCLHAPTHRSDCTGKLGLTLIGDTHGPSAMEKIWAALDLLTDELKSGAAKAAGELFESKARASAYCYALALMMNPVEPDMQAIRTEAMRRWKERNNER